MNAYWEAFNLANTRKPVQAVALNGQVLPRSTSNNWILTPQVGG